MKGIKKLFDKIKRLFHRLFIPKYTEIGLFLMSLTVFLLLIFSSSFRERIYYLFSVGGLSFTLVALSMSFGMFLSIYHVVVKRLITKEDKKTMVCFAVLLEGGVGIEAGLYVLRYTSGFWMIFPILNIISAVFLLMLFRMDVIKEDSLLDKQAKKTEVIFGAVFTILIFFFSHYVLKNYWAITFSICTAYAINLNEIFHSLIFRK